MRNMATREEWLRACLTRVTAGWPVGADLPENTRISAGFPQKGRRRGAGRISEHYPPSQSEGGVYEIFISPTIAEAFAVANAVAFEAARIATGRTPSGEELEVLAGRVRSIVATLPPYPHSAMKADAGPVEGAAPTRPGSRLLKASCPSCGYTARITRRWLRVAVPPCPGDATHGIMLVEGGA